MPREAADIVEPSDEAIRLEPTLSPSDDGDLRCQGTPNRIGSKLYDSCSQRPIADEFSMRDSESR